MKLSEMPALREVVDRQGEDPEFREEWDRITAGTGIAFHFDVRDGAVALTA